MTSTKQKHPLDAARDHALAIIGQIADRAVLEYAKHKVRIERKTVLMDLTACHFGPQKLHLEELLAADPANFLHDVAGINNHLDRVELKLTDCFSPRFSERTLDEEARGHT